MEGTLVARNADRNNLPRIVSNSTGCNALIQWHRTVHCIILYLANSRFDRLLVVKLLFQTITVACLYRPPDPDL